MILLGNHWPPRACEKLQAQNTGWHHLNIHLADADNIGYHSKWSHQRWKHLYKGAKWPPSFKASSCRFCPHDYQEPLSLGISRLFLHYVSLFLIIIIFHNFLMITKNLSLLVSAGDFFSHYREHDQRSQLRCWCGSTSRFAAILFRKKDDKWHSVVSNCLTYTTSSFIWCSSYGKLGKHTKKECWIV